MARPLKTILAILAWLIAADIVVALVLSAGIGPLAPLERYFDYGRSVPGKLARWQAEPDMPGNLFDVGWIEDVTRRSAEGFAAEGSETGQVVRSYGMSFANDIMRAARDEDPALTIDLAGAPAAPPNWALATFQADMGNRRPGDVVVLGVLSSAVPAMFSLSNRTRNFEQPAPLTYPVFRLESGDTLIKTEPLITSPAAERALVVDPAARAAWADQLRREDALWQAGAFELSVLDSSPFLRLLRRSLATSAIDDARAQIAADTDRWQPVLAAMMLDFARQARAEGLTPVVLLIQTQGGGAPDLARHIAPALAADGVAYLATVEHVDPRQPGNFLPDGHYTKPANAVLARAFLSLIASP